jgi:hypothetical protein
MTVSGRAADPKVLSAISVPVRSFDDAKTKLSARHRLTEGKNGGSWIEGIGGRPASREGSQSDDRDDDEQQCLLAHGNAGDRIVCGEREAVESLAPYLSRTMPKLAFTSDVHFELRTTPMRQYATQVRALVPLLTRGVIGSGGGALRDLLDAATGELVDFVGDTDKLAFDIQVGDGGADGTLRIDYGKAQSLLARVGASHPERADAPPAAFFHLPGDADLGFWARASEPKLFDHLRELVGKAFDEIGAQGGIPEAERKAMRELVADKMLGLLGSPMVYGKGFDQAALDKAIAARKAAAGPIASNDAELAVAEQIFGWHLLQVGEPIAKVGPILRDWSALWNRPAFVKWAKERASQKRLAKMRTAAAPAGAPRDTLHLEITLPEPEIDVAAAGAGGKPKLVAPKPIVFHVLAAPDGGSTWLGFGLDGKLLAQKASAALASAPDKDTFGKTPAADAFRTAKANGGGFLTLRGLAVFTALEEGRRSPYAMLGTLASKGATPIVLTHVALAPAQPNAAAGSSVATFKLPRAAIEDIARVVIGGR